MSPCLDDMYKRVEMLIQAEDKTGFEEAMFDKRGFVFRQTDLRPCVCGREAVIEPWIRSSGSRQEWIIRCPDCDRHTEPSADYEEVRDRWNSRRFTETSERLNRPLKQFDQYGLERLIYALLQMDVCAARAVIRVKRRAHIQEQKPEEKPEQKQEQKPEEKQEEGGYNAVLLRSEEGIPRDRNENRRQA